MSKLAHLLADSLANLVGEIATDVRQHVVEEPWFGHPVTSGPANYYEGFWERYGTPDQWKVPANEMPADQELTQSPSIDID